MCGEFRLFSLCSKFLEAFPSDCGAWTKFAGLEAYVGETERARAVFELAIRQPVLDMPETLWKEYIDFEVQRKRELLGSSTRLPSFDSFIERFLPYSRRYTKVYHTY